MRRLAFSSMTSKRDLTSPVQSNDFKDALMKSSASQSIFVALLRGVNVGGKNMINMSSLKTSFEQLGFKDVSTYINSGNILFKSKETDARKLEKKIEQML